MKDVTVLILAITLILTGIAIDRLEDRVAKLEKQLTPFALPAPQVENNANS